MAFSGSYDPTDVTFLLKPVELAPTSLEAKEVLIQSGRRHYSEMISREAPPSPEYQRIFAAAQERNGLRFAQDLLRLAATIAERRSGPLTLVSLARAGTPVGVILTRILRNRYQREVNHYSISIIRDRGIDTQALAWILARHPAASLVFLDGWTGKGVIARELAKYLTVFNHDRTEAVPTELFVVADLAGFADYAASFEDYLIPSGILGATISGLVSRSILNYEVLGPDDFHGCLELVELAPYDLSRQFADQITSLALDSLAIPDSLSHPRAELREQSRAFLAEIARRYQITDQNRIKPGIAEATRVLLRRVPDLLLVRDPADRDVDHALVLARERSVPIEVSPWLPYRAAALIAARGQ